MDLKQVEQEVKTKLNQVTDHFKEELKKLRTGRAHPGMLDSVMVEAYGVATQLKAVATVTTPEAQLIQITPFDPSNLQAISNAIRDDQALGLTPVDDGRVVRINLPPMTAENRASIVKVLHVKVEESHVSARNARHEAFKKIEQAEKDKTISRDERFASEKQVDELLAKQKNEVDQLATAKEKEITTI